MEVVSEGHLLLATPTLVIWFFFPIYIYLNSDIIWHQEMILSMLNVITYNKIFKYVFKNLDFFMKVEYYHVAKIS